MRILVLHSELGVLRGGGENFTRNLFTALATRGHRISAAFVADRNGNYPIPLPAGIEPIPILGSWSRQRGQATMTALGGRLATGSWGRRHWEHLQDAVSWRVIRRHNTRFRERVDEAFRTRWPDFDLAYVHGDALLAGRTARQCPTVLRLPGPVTQDMEPVLRGVHVVCANGDALVRIRTFLGEHVRELPVGIDSAVFRPGPSPVRAALNWTHEQTVFGYVGRLTLLKGIDLLVSAFRDVRKRVPNARLLIIGKGEMGRAIRSALANELAHQIAHIEPDLEHRRLVDWYRAMDFLVLPSRYENFSNALLEAVSCGVPVLASDVGGNGTLATRAGTLFEPDSAAALVDCLCAAAKETPAMKRRAQNLSSQVREQYDWSASAERLESMVALHAPTQQLACNSAR